MSNMRTETWYGHDIRFVEINDEWYAILKDICDALKLKVKDVSKRISPDMMERVLIDTSDLRSVEPTSNERKRGERKSIWMLAINEAGIYQALFASRKLEARKFQLWTLDILKKLRKSVGLEGYEVMRMTEPDIQEEIDSLLNILYYDQETGKAMVSITVQGGDTDQISLDEYMEE